MSERTELPWIHIGECPVCVNGLCRVRTCRSPGGEPHFYALCDECEALWLQPDTAAEFVFCDAESPRCPICDQALYGPHAHWSTPGDIQGTLWAAQAIFAMPSQELGESVEDRPDRPESQAPNDWEATTDDPTQQQPDEETGS